MRSPETAMRVVWFTWWITWLAAAFWRDRAVKRPPRREQIAYRVLATAGAIMLLGMYRHDVHSEGILWVSPDLLTWPMVGAAILGFAFTWWARIHLGRLWSSSVTRKADHHIVDTGPYGIVRHPIYTGVILASVATAILRGTAVAWLGAAVMTFGWYIKARLEERFLREQLGAAGYDAYARRVPMLVPSISKRG